MTTATELVQMLRDAGLSQSEIARRTGVPQHKISRWQAGNAPAGADDALKLLYLAKRIRARRRAADRKDAAHA